MLYRKNLPSWERFVRILAGIVMIVCGLAGLKGVRIGYLIACGGMFTLVTGFVGYCPACAVAGRKGIEK